MLPLRANRPMTPLPGTTGRRSSSSTTVSTTAVTVGPPRMAVFPGETMARPWAPLSEAPTASVITRLGRCRKNWSFTEGEKMAAVLLMASSEDGS